MKLHNRNLKISFVSLALASAISACGGGNPSSRGTSQPLQDSYANAQCQNPIPLVDPSLPAIASAADAPKGHYVFQNIEIYMVTSDGSSSFDATADISTRFRTTINCNGVKERVRLSASLQSVEWIDTQNQKLADNVRTIEVSFDGSRHPSAFSQTRPTNLSFRDADKPAVDRRPLGQGRYISTRTYLTSADTIELRFKMESGTDSAGLHLFEYGKIVYLRR